MQSRLFDEKVNPLRIIIFLFFLNSVYILLRYNIGYELISYLYLREDRFADMIKYGLSAKIFFLNFDQTEQFNSLEQIYKNYYMYNPYRGIDGIGTPYTHFMHVPIYLFITVFFTSFIRVGFHPEFIMLMYIFTLLFIYTVYIYKYIKNIKTLFYALALFLINYPMLLIYTRGNVAGLTSLSYMVFIYSVYKFDGELDTFPAIMFALFLPLRITSLIFLLLYIKYYRNDMLSPFCTIHRFVIICLKHITLSLVFLGISFLLIRIFYQDFTIYNYYLSTTAFTKHYLCSTGYRPCDASLFALLCNLGFKDWQLIKITYLIITFFLCAMGFVTFFKSRSYHEASYILITLYFLIGPVSAGYHLILYIAPILIFIDERHNDNSIIFFSSLLLSPYTFVIRNIDVQPFIYHFIMIGSLIYIFYKNIFRCKRN